MSVKENVLFLANQALNRAEEDLYRMKAILQRGIIKIDEEYGESGRTLREYLKSDKEQVQKQPN